MNNLSILYKKEGSETKAFLKGALVSLAALDLKSMLYQKVITDEKLVVDLTDVTDIDTTGVNTLFQTQMHCDSVNTHMVLKCQTNHPINHLLKLTHSTNQFEIEMA